MWWIMYLWAAFTAGDDIRRRFGDFQPCLSSGVSGKGVRVLLSTNALYRLYDGSVRMGITVSLWGWGVGSSLKCPAAG